jgi:hypothetical protein
MPPLGLDYFSFFEGKEGADSEIVHGNCYLKFDRQPGDEWALCRRFLHHWGRIGRERFYVRGWQRFRTSKKLVCWHR